MLAKRAAARVQVFCGPVTPINGNHTIHLGQIGVDHAGGCNVIQHLVKSLPRYTDKLAMLVKLALVIAQLLDWQPRLLDFDSAPLAEVVETFNRRNPRRLVIGDDELRALTIVASIRSDNVEGFVRLLEGTMGVRAERTPSGEIVLRRAR